MSLCTHMIGVLHIAVQITSAHPTPALVHSPAVSVGPVLLSQATPLTLGRHHQRRYELDVFEIVGY